MSCCIPGDCGEYAVTPMLVAPCPSVQCCQQPPLCYPVIPPCQTAYCCRPVKRLPKTPPQTPPEPRCEIVYCPEPCQRVPLPQSPTSRQKRPKQPIDSAEKCCHVTCKPVKTKYVMPCYRYEDGRIEKYITMQRGRLPLTTYQRNGMQDQMHGYKGTIQYLCSMPGCPTCSVHMVVEPLKKLFPKITKEVFPVQKKQKKEACSPCD